ncbi:multidrug resistance protein [Anaerohalosphaera lusitana]|uniref:Multidrug resistance protein n=1 Tax=Anaerohalosphaera lusitana TaxID=1936003 RepID=A0A1U9NGV1_9BACT|nr:MFS transporter [Anaerohalosphaera lusitana]AQT67035.1 multidrug resistance protein [Anaerohalosphaera lusitana]
MAKPDLENSVIFRFSLYGFLKNQRYFEPFLILAFHADKGLSFFAIGLLIGFRELMINLLEIPSGALADLYGRRMCMITAFVAYTISFVVFGVSSVLWHLYIAMLLFAVGEAFRTGTHKAMIFAYLHSKGADDMRVQVYGFTRSWSKIGSALSAAIAGGLVFWRGNYSDIFWLCAIPSAMNVINFMTYPDVVEAGRNTDVRGMRVFGHVWESVKIAWSRRAQRMLLLESSGFEGVFKIAKDYIQPVIKSVAIGLPFLAALEDQQRTAILIGLAYTLVHLVSSVASRRAHTIGKWAGGDESSAMWIWGVVMVCYALLVATLGFGWFAIATPVFVAVYMLQNFYRPLLVSRLNAVSEKHQAATTLSIESQLKSLVAMIVAPLLGFSVDQWGLWSVGLAGFVVSAAFWLNGRIAARR